jgi:hypothetical protein
MNKIVLAVIIILGCAVGRTTQVLAHGDAPHPKCKKGYELNDAHKCVKAVKK